MTHDRTKMPSDELMGKVVARWKGWKYLSRIEHGTPRLCRSMRYPSWRSPLSDMTGDNELDYVADPRSDTDAALELLGHLRKLGHNICYEPGGFQYRSGVYRSPFGSHQDDRVIPISGETFRLGVCWLAVQLLGIDETPPTIDAPIDKFSWCKVRTPGTPGCSIQWKGTDVCVDLYCPCGHDSNFVGQFLYAWQCPSCKKVWEMGDEVKMREVHHHSCMQEIIEHD